MFRINLPISRRTAVAACLALLLAPPAFAQDAAIAPSTAPPPPHVAAVTARHGMVASQDKWATQIGVEILQQGGNAIDAAVAVGFALAVTLPKAGNIGGGGFMVIHRANAAPVTIDYRETAPRDTAADVFLDGDGHVDPAKSRNSGLAAGVPGTVAGLAMALDKFGSGKFTLADLLAPAIRFARNGVPVEDDLIDSLLLAQPRLARWPSSARIFLKADGKAWRAGERLMQADLAATLERIATAGPRGFYTGAVAEEIVAAVRQAGGRMSAGDLADYAPVLREPVRGTYRGYDILSMPPPSSGGVHLIEMLNILEGFPLGQLGAGSPAALHLLIEAMKPAYADRAEFMGDSDAVEVPIARLTSKAYAASLRDQIDPRRARPASDYGPPRATRDHGGNTTHFSIVDAAGNAVANTYSLNFNYGLGLVAGSTGVLLNNTLDDFAAKPGVPNAFDLVGGAANAPGPGKRPLSSMTPTIVLKDGKPAIVTGAPGGSRIITAVLQVLVNAIDFRLPLTEAVAAPRLHQQWQPDEVQVERTLPPAIVEALKVLGHKLRVGATSGSAHSIAMTPDGLVGAADPRAKGAQAAGY